MINKALYQDHIKIQYYFYLVVLVMYQFFDGIYRPYHLNNDIMINGVAALEHLKKMSKYKYMMATPDSVGFTSYRYAVLINALVWIVFIVALVFMQFHILRKKENISFMGSLPITRKSVICTTYLSGVSVLGMGYVVHFMAVLSHNSAENGMSAAMIVSLLRAGLFFLGVYTILFVTQTFVVKNKWWLVFGSLTGVALLMGMITSRLLANFMPGFIIRGLLQIYDKLYVMKYIVINYFLVDNQFYTQMPQNHMLVYWGMTVGLVLLIILSGYLAIWFYCKRDDANGVAVFAVHIPRTISVLYGAGVGYCLSVIPIYVALLMASMLGLLLSEVFSFGDVPMDSGEKVGSLVIVIMMCVCTVAGGMIAHMIAKKNDAKEGR